MRAAKELNGITLKAYAGTTGILLAFNVTGELRKDLLGFAIRRKIDGKAWKWLQGSLRFPGEEVDLKPVNSNIAPIQKFRWSDYAVYPETKYTYEVWAVYGSPGNLSYIQGPEVTVKTESVNRGKHRIVFNRAVAASQAYSRRFGKTNPDDKNDPRYLEARDWLSRGMLQHIEKFIKKAKNSDYALDLALFEFEYDGFVELLRKQSDKGVRISIIYHGQPGDGQTLANEEHLKPIADEFKRARHTSALFHQKFIVLKQKNESGEYVPRAVLTGTANFTPNGLWRQANVIHVIFDRQLANEYEKLYRHLLTSDGYSDTKKFIRTNFPLLKESNLFQSFSPRSGYVDIDLLEEILHQASSEVFICSAFKLHDRISAALDIDNPKVCRFGLQNSRSTITGIHRNRSFVVPAFLKEGLEGFLKESTAKQKGNIYIHLKTIITDFTTSRPTVIVGSHNFSEPASAKNDENFVVIKGDTEVADTYFCEMMRLYDHYRFRHNLNKKGTGSDSLLCLRPDDSWTNDYYDPGNLKYDERMKFSVI